MMRTFLALLSVILLAVPAGAQTLPQPTPLQLRAVYCQQMVDYEIENIDPGMDKVIVDFELSMHHTPEDYHWTVNHDRETAHRITRFLSAQDIASLDPTPLQSARAAGVEDAKRCHAAMPALIDKGMQSCGTTYNETCQKAYLADHQDECSPVRMCHDLSFLPY